MLLRSILFVLLSGYLSAASVQPEVRSAAHEMVVAGHPEAAEAGLGVLRAGGNAIDAAVSVSLSLGVAEPYASGLGGKIEILYYESATKRVFIVDGMDQASTSLPVSAFLKKPDHERTEGGPSAAVPGLAAGLYEAHRRWGSRPWAEDVKPAQSLALRGALVYPKTVQLMEESRARFQGNPEACRIYLPGGSLPKPGSRLSNEDLAHTLSLLAEHGPDAIYRGSVAASIVATVHQAGGYMTLEDLAGYRARVLDPVSVPFENGRLYSTPPVSGGATVLAVVAALHGARWAPGAFRNAANLDQFGKMLRAVYPRSNRAIGDVQDTYARAQDLLSPSALNALRSSLGDPSSEAGAAQETGLHSTTHFIVVDQAHNVVCVTQSLSLHFGCGLVPPGTGILLNDSLSDFGTRDPKNPNFVGAGKRPRSTIAPTLWLDAQGLPLLAIGLPGGGRITTGLAQVILDYVDFNRPLADAIGDTRLHVLNVGAKPTYECEEGLPASEQAGLRARGWNVNSVEPAGTGGHFGGVNAVEFLPDHSLRGIADTRRTNAARGD